MDLHYLGYLLALAVHHSFRKAADALFLTQPVSSRSLQALKQELGVPLIDRNGPRNRLTAYGREVKQPARCILSDTAELRRNVSRRKDGSLYPPQRLFRSGTCHGNRENARKQADLQEIIIGDGLVQNLLLPESLQIQS